MSVVDALSTKMSICNRWNWTPIEDEVIYEDGRSDCTTSYWGPGVCTIFSMSEILMTKAEWVFLICLIVKLLFKKITKKLSSGNLQIVGHWAQQFYLVHFQVSCFSQAISGQGGWQRNFLSLIYSE